jgi:hypothetical protein
MGGLGKTTACKILANDVKVRQKFHEGLFWIEFGQDSSADAVVDQLVHVTGLSGGIETSASIFEASTKIRAGQVVFAKVVRNTRGFVCGG